MALLIVLFGIYALIKFLSMLVSLAASKTKEAIERERKERIKFQRQQEQMWAAQRKADQRRDAQLAKHEEEIAKLKFKMDKAEADIEHWNETVNCLYALLDYELLEQSGCVPGSSSDIKHQKQIITLNGKIHAAEQKIAKARFDRGQAEAKMVA